MIMDYGSAKFTDQIAERISAEAQIRRATSTKDVGTLSTNPPESRSNSGSEQTDYDPGPFDVWSCACILFGMLAADKLHNVNNNMPAAHPFHLNDNWAGDPGRKHIPGFAIFQHMTTPDGRFPDLRNIFDCTDRSENGVPVHVRFWGYVDTLPGGLALTPHLRDLFGRMLDLDPDRRITMAAILEHPWLTEADGDTDADFRADMESRRA